MEHSERIEDRVEPRSEVKVEPGGPTDKDDVVTRRLQQSIIGPDGKDCWFVAYRPSNPSVQSYGGSATAAKVAFLAKEKQG